MKIGMVCYPSYGGSGVVATELGYALGEQGHEVHFISSARPFRLHRFHEKLFFHEVTDVNYPLFKFPPYTLLLANKIVEVANYVGLDVIHAHYAIPHSISALLAKQMMTRPLPLVTTLHGTDVTLVGAFEEFYNLTRLGLKSSDQITAVSRSLARDTVEIFGPINQDIKVIPNFIDPNVYLPMKGLMDRCRRYFAPQGEKILAHISNFREVKRVVDVVRIFSLVEKVTPCRLLLVGDGPEMVRVEREAVKLGLEKKVMFLGKQESVKEILQMVDVFILPSEQESFGLVALEAMACGVPVIASRVGGLPEVVIHGKTGYLAEVGDVVGMSEAVLSLLTDDLRYKSFSEQAVTWAREMFPVERAVKEYESVYEDAIQGPRS
ncbi:N-acetyl-alpha-D-glucosaminyl L-malate synthase BshA [Desulfosporosinus sp. BICA1-9]|uniref:N-acetyl-alpha-D-glucosaminyl L-malate synthase BshA n=1 Tax=Desulfosporosinus sp. BICA1-9 TaxID=1531958 RepID=UPI00054B9EDB|nr:N-acetyl-alpha-D-glucosaminyl L-malate synthase BshA [Desulfosporosinus sp. BICA1-9]KJS48077.1 MAG: N-acetyl-alpha-D-glucosaminyl L-malate synthase [Peptococcaceae bacterium BRH_c23]KJS78487.1 MAG: N-acetyl-alpha-D-glucosaminyl L-malate synthase [Desulfosporosinus sp. BICA1-9]HBW36088.1 N-acetyl-alpha-D-glucosaminyl L-malate synthase BshA [Desulfosporosinus sp.]